VLRKSQGIANFRPPELRLNVSTRKVQRAVSYLGTQFTWICFLQAYAEIVVKFEVATASFSYNCPDLNSFELNSLL